MNQKTDKCILLVGSGDVKGSEWVKQIKRPVIFLKSVKHLLVSWPFLEDRVDLLIVDPFVTFGDDKITGLKIKEALNPLNSKKMVFIPKGVAPRIMQTPYPVDCTLLEILTEPSFMNCFNGLFPYKGRVLISTSLSITQELASKLYAVPLDIVGIIPDHNAISPRHMVQAINATMEHDFQRRDEAGYRILAQWPITGASGPVNSKLLMIDRHGIIEAGLLTRQDPLDRQMRTSVCVPYIFSGAKCANGCVFCRHATRKCTHGRLNLTPEEMLSTVQKSIKGDLFHREIGPDDRFSIAMNGGGDPGLSKRVLCNAIRAIELFNKTFKARLIYTLFSTISVKAVEKLIFENPDKVVLQVTATFAGKERKKYMPEASSIKELVAMGVQYVGLTKRKMVINHMLIDGLTDTDDAVDAVIAEILGGVGDNKKLLPDIMVKLSSFEPHSGLEITDDWKLSRGRAKEVAARFEKAGLTTVFWTKHASSEGGSDVITRK